jgi:hypothetical protein
MNLTDVLDEVSSRVSDIARDVLGVDADIVKVAVEQIVDRTTLTVVVDWDPDDMRPESRIDVDTP